jgi:glycolate oxidase
MLDSPVIKALQSIVGDKRVLTRKVDLVAYTFDATTEVPKRIPAGGVFIPCFSVGGP